MTDEVKIEVVADDQSAPVLEKAQANITETGAAADKAAPKIKGLDDRLRGLGDSTTKSNRPTEEQAKRLDRAGDAADGAEGKFTGLASGIDGVTTLMDNPSPQEFAQGIADMADGAANSLVPALKAVRDHASGMLQKLTGASSGIGALGRAAVGAAGIAGIGLLVNAIQDAEQARKALRVEELTEEFTALGSVDFTGLDVLQGGVMKTFEKLLEQSPRLAQGYIDWMEAVSDGAAETGEMQERVDMAADAQEGLAEATAEVKTNLDLEAEASQELRDELDRLMGKSFDVADAQASVTLGIADMAETVKTNREEIGAAATSLDLNTAAGARNHEMITGLVEDQADYITALKDSGVSNEELVGKIDQSVGDLERQLIQMGFTKDQVKIYTAALRQVPSTIRTNIGVRGVEQSIHDVDRIRAELEALNGYTSYVRIVGTQVGVVLPGGARFNEHGGLIGAATGGIHSSLRVVGEHGPELVSLPTGSMVHSNPDSERMMADAAGGGERTLRIILEGTGILNGIRREVFYDFGGNVQAALGVAT